MARLRSQIDTRAQTCIANRAGLSTLLRHHDAQVAMALAGGGEKYNARHRARGKMLARERCRVGRDRQRPDGQGRHDESVHAAQASARVRDRRSTA